MSPLEAVGRLKPGSNPVYAPRDVTGDGARETFCNFFLADCARLCGVDLPQMLANLQVEWLQNVGPTKGWCQVPSWVALALASAGHFVACGWRNHAGHGHVAVLLPGEALTIAQAGRTCFDSGTLESGFGRLPVSFFAHRV